MSVPIQAALISALTAAVVTLVIEYLAKPRLEARKDRIVEAARNRREIRARFLSLSYKIRLLKSNIDDEGLPRIEQVEVVRDEALRLGDDVMKLEAVLDTDRWSEIIQPLIACRVRLDVMLKTLRLAQEHDEPGSELALDAVRRYASEADDKVLRAFRKTMASRRRLPQIRRTSVAAKQTDSSSHDHAT